MDLNHTHTHTHKYQMATEEEVVVVTINYRLGPLGFLVTAAQGGVGGFNGVRDAVLALKWVRENIAAFGGDANKITVAVGCIEDLKLIARDIVCVCYLSI